MLLHLYDIDLYWFLILETGICNVRHDIETVVPLFCVTWMNIQEYIHPPKIAKKDLHSAFQMFFFAFEILILKCRRRISFHCSLLSILPYRQLILLCDLYDPSDVCDNILPIAMSLAGDRVADVRFTSYKLVRIYAVKLLTRRY